MSRVGKHAVKIPSGVTVNILANRIEASGKVGKDFASYNDLVVLEQSPEQILVKPANETAASRAMWGTVQRSLSNLVKGVSEGFTKNIELVGVGYRASVQGNVLNLQLGFSHDITYPIPQGITIKCEKPTSIAVSGASKQQVGQLVAEISKHRKPEPYKGKGAIPEGKFVLRKEGKKK